MTPKISAIIITALGPLITSIEQDYQTYREAKEDNPEVEFDWGIWGFKFAKACIWAFGAAFGVSQVVPE